MAEYNGMDWDDWEFINKEEARECQEQFQEGGIEACKSFILRKTEEWKTIPLDIGIVGNSGTGKSSFINAIRDLTADDEGAAEVGTTETTSEPKPYAHPNNPLMKFWDLPGVGTPNFPQDDYLEQINFIKYDFFLIVSSERFTENDKWLAREVTAKQKQFFFIRTKIDHSIGDDKHDHPRTHDPDRVLAGIHQDIKKNLQDLYDEQKVFLISNHKRVLYDFERLQEHLIDTFPALKQEALIMSLSNFSERLVKKKVKVLRGLIWQRCIVSGLVAAVPVPGLSVAVDLVMILEQSRYYFKQLGLDDESLQRMAKTMKCDVSGLNQIVQKQANFFLTIAGIKDLILKIPLAGVAVMAEEGARYFPFLGSILGAPISYYTTHAVLNLILTKMEEVALLVVKVAITSVGNDDTDE